MSHAVVLVIGDDVDGQLAAYSEERRVDPYRSYDPDPWFSRLAKDEGGIDPTDPHALAAFANKRWPGEEQYEVDEQGLFLWSTYNPESKWDWYVIGGRWAGTLIVRPLIEAAAPNVRVNSFSDGRHTDTALSGEVDWPAMALERLSKLAARWDGYEKVLTEAGEEAAKQAAYWDFGLEQDEVALGREAHLARAATLNPLHWIQAVVAEGVWREKGRMGWFGASTDGPDEREQWDDWFTQFMARMPDNTRLTIVDYHI